ncbi:MAG: tetratricopeptide repeat protein, partial [Chloroflexota bacterium]|nr:tetratricopeptide repeat protein [Chloroflexota bacterium]
MASMLPDVKPAGPLTPTDPHDPLAWNELGKARLREGDFPAAAEAFHQAVVLAPQLAEAQFHLGGALQRLHQLDAAEEALRRALELLPENAAIHNNLGLVLLGRHRLGEAERCFRAALSLLPASIEAQTNLGKALVAQNRLAEAEGCYRLAIERDAARAVEAINGLAVVLRDLGRLPEALSAALQALQLRPDYLEALNTHGTVLLHMGRLDEARDCFERVLAEDEQCVPAYSNIARVLHEQGDFAESERYRRRALALDPDDAETHFGLSFTLLAQGRLEEGFEEYEWRWRTRQFSVPTRCSVRPVWDGRPLSGETVLVNVEQGFGDAIQFSRFVPALGKLGARVVLRCQPELKELLRTSAVAADVVDFGEAAPEHDLEIPLLSLPHRLGIGLEALPFATAYLAADGARAAKWAERLSGPGGLKVGLCWAGNTENKLDHRRSIDLAQLAPLAVLEGVRWFSLYKGARPASLAAP